MDLIGNEQKIVVSGCTHGTVGSIVRGSYTLASQNHGRPAYKKDSQVNGLDVMMYYWNERDGPAFSGWWFGPKIGGDQVWAYHPRNTPTPPKSGWKVPYDGPVDHTMAISASAAAPPPQGQQAWGGKAGSGQLAKPQDQWGQQQQPQQQQQWGQQSWSQPQKGGKGDKGNKGGDKGGGQDKGFSKDKGFGKEQGFGKDKGFGQAQGFGQDKGVSKDKGGGKDKGCKGFSGGKDTGFGVGSFGGGAGKDGAFGGGYGGGKDGKDKGKGKAAPGKGGGWNDSGGGWQAQTQNTYQQQQNLQALQQQQQAQIKQKQEELKRKAEEEKKKADEEVAKKKAEQAAAMNIRRVIQKLRTASEPTFEELKKELTEVMEKDLEKCGSMKDKVKEEADKGVEQVTTRIETIKKTKEEAEKKRKELQEKAEGLLKKLEGLVGEASEAATAVKEAGSSLSADDISMDDVSATSKTMEEASADAKAKLKLCTDFIMERGKEIAVPKMDGAVDVKGEWAKLLTRTNESARGVDASMRTLAAVKLKTGRRDEAKKIISANEALFAKYDKDKDGYLSNTEVKAYAKGAFSFTIPAESVDAIFDSLAENEPKGVKKTFFQHLKVAVACAREKIKDAELRKAREEKEKMLADMKAELQEKVDSAMKSIEATEELVKKAEQAAQPLPSKAKELQSTEMTKLADEVEEAIKVAKESCAETHKIVEAVTEGADEELKSWLNLEVTKLQAKVKRWEPRLAKATGACSNFQTLATSKERAELDALEKRVVAMIRYHQQESKLSKEQVFEAFDADKDGKISQGEFLAFFASCKKEEPKEAEDGKVAPKKEPPTEEEMIRVFSHLDEEDGGSLSNARFCCLIRRIMKVATETAITSSKSIKEKENKTLRRLEVGEILEVLEGPTEDESTPGVLRVRALAMKDSIEGWVTMKGNQGTQYLKDGGNFFKVINETILTGGFELDAAPDKDTPKKVKESTRKLKEGELLEVREWPKLEEKSKLTRMKCKAKSDGMIGWATTVGNQGKVFIQMM